MTTPWPAMLRLAVSDFHIAPEAFWRLSLKEWRALSGEGGPQALDREGFDALTRAYPDGPLDAERGQDKQSRGTASPVP